MKHRQDPLTAIEDVRRRLGAPRVNISVLWVVVTQLASDLQWALAQLDAQRNEIRALESIVDRVNGPEPTYYVAPVGGSDSAEPSSETEDQQPCLFDVP